MIQLILGFLLLIQGSQIDPLTQFDFNSSTAHEIYGQIITAGITPEDPPIYGDAFMIIEPALQRFQSWYTITLPNFSPPITVSTFHVILSNASYSWGDALHPECSIVSGYNYTNLVNEYKDAVSQIGSFNPGFSTYSGLVKDFASCGKNAGVSIKLHNNLFYTFSGSVNQLVPLPGGGSFCYHSKTIFNFSPPQGTIEYPNPNFNEDFVLPSGCYPENNPPNFCDLTIPCD